MIRDRDRIRLQPLESHAFEPLRELASGIWRTHYPGIISPAQIEYMLHGRFTAEALGGYLDCSSRWLELLYVEARLSGYCSYALGDAADELKLEQLYLHAELRGQGLGGFLLERVEARARTFGRTRVVLTVNKANSGAIAVYRRRGFTVRAEVCVDIGGGFVMDDFVMEKSLR